MSKYRIVKTHNSITYPLSNEIHYWYKLEKKRFLSGWVLIGSGYFETDYEAEQALKPDRIISEFED